MKMVMNCLGLSILDFVERVTVDKCSVKLLKVCMGACMPVSRRTMSHPSPWFNHLVFGAFLRKTPLFQNGYWKNKKDHASVVFLHLDNYSFLVYHGGNEKRKFQDRTREFLGRRVWLFIQPKKQPYCQIFG